MSDRSSGVSTAAVLGGAALIALGAWLLLGRSLAFAPAVVTRVYAVLAGAVGPLALVGLGVLVIVFANRGAFDQAPDVEGKRWTRSRADRRISGVLGGLAAYLGVDPTLVRLAYVLITLVTGFWVGVLAYVIATVVVPEAPVESSSGPTAPPAPPKAE